MILSKSHYVSGLRCPKQLWLKAHEPDAPELEADEALQARFDTGHRVGELARARSQPSTSSSAWATASRCSR